MSAACCHLGSLSRDTSVLFVSNPQPPPTKWARVYCGFRPEPTNVMTHLGRMVSHQSASSCLRVCLCGDCCCRVWWWLQRPVLLHTLLERCRDTVSCDLGITLPPVSSYMTTLLLLFFTGRAATALQVGLLLNTHRLRRQVENHLHLLHLWHLSAA